jgi:cell division protein FtsL
MVVSLVLAVGSLLSVADAQAYLTQGQVRLARLQQQLTGEQARHRDLELQVADLEDPSQVVNKAQQQGLTVPAQVTDLPLVATPASLAHATAPATTSPSTDRSGGRR